MIQTGELIPDTMKTNFVDSGDKLQIIKII